MQVLSNPAEAGAPARVLRLVGEASLVKFGRLRHAKKPTESAAAVRPVYLKKALREYGGRGVPSAGTPWVLAANRSRGGKLVLALGNITRRTGAGKPAKLSHPVHRILKFFKFALQIEIFQFVTVHVRFEHFRRKHLGAAP